MKFNQQKNLTGAKLERVFDIHSVDEDEELRKIAVGEKEELTESDVQMVLDKWYISDNEKPRKVVGGIVRGLLLSKGNRVRPFMDTTPESSPRASPLITFSQLVSQQKVIVKQVDTEQGKFWKEFELFVIVDQGPAENSYGYLSVSADDDGGKRGLEDQANLRVCGKPNSRSWQLQTLTPTESEVDAMDVDSSEAGVGCNRKNKKATNHTTAMNADIMDENALRNRFDNFRSKCISSTNEPLKISSVDVFSFFEEFNEHIVKVTNLSFIDEMMIYLNNISRKHTFNILKKSIIMSVYRLLDYYFFTAAVQNKCGQINLKLLTSFASLEPTHVNYSATAKASTEAVKSEVAIYNEKLKVYANLAIMITNAPTINDEFLFDLNKAKVLFLTIKKHIFTKHQLEHIAKQYDKYSEDTNLQELFKNLFLQINKDEAEFVKNFLIEKREHEVLINLFDKFSHLTLNEYQIALIYKKETYVCQDVFGRMLWLETVGMEICHHSRALTQSMAQEFLGVLNEGKTDGRHVAYSKKILYGLSYFLTDEKIFFECPYVNKLVFVNMFTKLVDFLNNKQEKFSSDKEKMKIILKLIENKLNSNLLSEQELAKTITNLFSLITNFNLKFIDIFGSQEVLVLDPNTNNHFNLFLKYKLIIITLVKYIQMNSSENLEKLCKKAIYDMNKPRVLRFMPNNQKVAFNNDSENSVEMLPNKKRRLTRSFSLQGVST